MFKTVKSLNHKFYLVKLRVLIYSEFFYGKIFQMNQAYRYESIK